MTRRLPAIIFVAATALVASAHVGDDNVYFAGDAGPYPVYVSVLLPGVVPGLAQVAVDVRRDGVERVTVQPVYWQTGTQGAPPPDEATLVSGETRLYAARLWLMTSGSYSVRVRVEGSAGSGELFVPVNNVASRRLEMQRPMGMTLAGLGLFLVVGLLTIVGAAVREGMLPPGEQPDARRRRRSWLARAAWAAGIVLALIGGNAWWSKVDASYRANLYRPLEVESRVSVSATGRTLTLTVLDSLWRAGRYTPLVPDHGKLVHLFLVRDATFDGFAHLHPVRLDSATFTAALPPIPPGRYRLYADVVHASGFARTLTDTVEVAGSTTSDRWRIEDPDASWTESPPVDGDAAPLSRGTLSWERGERLIARRPAALRFVARDSTGAPLPLEPYMGMLAHAAVTRDDGSVFVHLHPMGTISVAAQEQFARRSAGDTALVPSANAVQEHGVHAAHTEPGIVTFPYAFPSPGRYVVWVQVKTGGQIMTAAFRATVDDQ